ncbi:DNA-binding SARP family transcriptional activator [Tamaricihabitans halophyticus]|uniref:DNA-binding SARP family transcriptional activator n=1 Tax=Tamaricihabitans halophyticus TaxID=1262583 RepID=A0A4R2QV20_9PSEU|nr:BTAD domain-containing putative transcriptional regulator [Tamaricihabitans halophyticus]TCP53577.1 DNA-binding SARP family transcriptional activator [Tamaricihabitans halophyticus]
MSVTAAGSRRSLEDVVRGYRRRAGLTQRQVAERAGMSVASLRDLEQGRVATPRVGTLRKLADALELTAAETEELVQLSQSGKTETADLWVRILGPLAVRAGGVDVDPGPVRQRVLLGLLALTPNKTVGREGLIEAGWGEQPPANVVDLLQTSMSRLRRRLQAPQGEAEPARIITATRGGYQLTVADDQLDLLAFRARLELARKCRDAGDIPGACAAYRDAVELWRGDALADLPSLYVHPSVVALTGEWQTMVVEYAETAARLDRHEQVVPLLRRLTEADPLHESAHARLMVALAGSGQQAAALTVYGELRRRIADELGAEPGREVAEAHQRVLRQEVHHPEIAEPVTVRAHRQLPRDIADFTGRDIELTALRNKLTQSESDHAAAMIIAIEGMAGVGKTRLAVRLAYQLFGEGRFTDEHLYVDLRGHADQPPAEPATVLASFLHLLGVPGDQIPRGLDERAALYRARLREQGVLVLLDNAASAEQVLPLLPDSPRNAVLVTSRRSLALDGAHSLPLDVFSPVDARLLLTQIVGEERVAADAEAAQRVVELCGRLPLAVALIARRIQGRPAWSFADMTRRLLDASDRIDELTAGSRHVRAAFDLSYQALGLSARQMFRLLGLHPGDDFTSASAAAMVGCPEEAARRLLDCLVDEHLAIVVTGERYQLHDLVRAYARDVAERDEEDGGQAAVDRVLNWHLHAAYRAKSVLSPAVGTTFSVSDESPLDLPEFDDEDAAFSWFDAEHASVTGAVALGVEYGLESISWQLTALLRTYFERTSEWDRWVSVAQLGLAAARRVGDRAGEALLLSDLGLAYGQLDELEQSARSAKESLEIRQAIGDRAGEGWSQNNLGIAIARCGDVAAARGHFQAAIELARKLTDTRFEAAVLSNLGQCHVGLGEFNEAVTCLRGAVELRRNVNDIVGIAISLHCLGAALLGLDRYEEAIPLLQESCELCRQQRYRAYEAEALETLGKALREVNREAEAQECWERGLKILAEIRQERAAGTVS